MALKISFFEGYKNGQKKAINTPKPLKEFFYKDYPSKFMSLCNLSLL